MGLPHSDPVLSDRKVKHAPMGAVHLAAMSASGSFQMRATALAAAMHE